MNQVEVFISYSRKDAAIVRALTQFLRAANQKVFRDEDGIYPGDDWKQVIVTSLAQSRLVYVMWCSHAEKSEWVERETEQAVETKKRVVPVLLDKTPLPDILKKYQAIDFSERIKHSTLLEAIRNAIERCINGLFTILREAGCALLILVAFLIPMMHTQGPGEENAFSVDMLIGLAVLASYLFGAIFVIAVVGAVLAHWFRVRRLGKELATAVGHISVHPDNAID